MAGILPADLFAEMYAETYERRCTFRRARKKITARALTDIRTAARARALSGLQDSLRDCGRRMAGARTLRALHPVLPEWVDRSHGHLSFHLTQLLTGHGCFSAFLCRIGKAEDDGCNHCDDGRDTAEHTLQACAAWGRARSW